MDIKLREYASVMLHSLMLVAFGSLVIGLDAKADVLPGFSVCDSDTQCVKSLRNTESVAYRCTLRLQAEVKNSAGRRAFVWSDEVRDFLIEANQETQARFDFSRELTEIRRSDLSYGNLSPTGEFEDNCKPAPDGGGGGSGGDTGSEADFSELGLYEVMAEQLSCNLSPKPCSNSACRAATFPKSTLLEATDFQAEEGQNGAESWMLVQVGRACWVRANSKYLKPAQGARAEDITSIVGSGVFRVLIEEIPCLPQPKPCRGSGCTELSFPMGSEIVAERIVNEAGSQQTVPWIREARFGCYLRATTRYLLAQ